MAVQLHEAGGSEAFAGFLHLRVGEGKPYFGYFVWGKEGGYQFDACAEKGYVVHSRFQRFLCTAPHTGTFDVCPDKVLFGKQFSKTNGVFPFSAAQFQYDGIVVFEKGFIPMTFHFKSFLLQGGERVLKYVRKDRHIIEFG
ncbi:hypothetical protein Barb6_02311 [Bacteroidales bacterium Barb6]|nr:hypothetical protein Barb6_02311 [Bacteroidales bacterium Barb6]